MSKHNGDQRHDDIQPQQLTAYALNQLEGSEREQVERLLADPSQAEARQAVADVRRVAATLVDSPPSAFAEPAPRLRDVVLARLEKTVPQKAVQLARPSRSRRIGIWVVVASAAAILAAAILLPAVQSAREAARRMQANNTMRQISNSLNNYHDTNRRVVDEGFAPSSDPQDQPLAGAPRTVSEFEKQQLASRELQAAVSEAVPFGAITSGAAGSMLPYGEGKESGMMGSGGSPGNGESAGNKGRGEHLNQFGDDSGVDGDRRSLATAETAAAVSESARITDELTLAKRPAKHAQGEHHWELRPSDFQKERARTEWREVAEFEKRIKDTTDAQVKGHSLLSDLYGSAEGEQYQRIVENAFVAPAEHPLSTFSIDVDTASYANVRRFLNSGSLPPPDAVRIEELVNYFGYSDPQPQGADPFSVNMEAAQCPWQPGHLLLRVGLQGKVIDRAKRPPSNLTFLLDVSGSMADGDKLPLLKTVLSMLVAELTEDDRVSIVTYAGDAGLRLPPTRGNDKQAITAAIDSLQSGGSTHGSAGIALAYEQAAQYFLKEGTNRVILATDGDLNVGVTSDDALVELIKQKAAGGTFLTVLGFGQGNLKDAKLEKLADNGNGIYAYIDGVREGRKVLVEQMSRSLVTIAKDVKIQIEFNPREIASYRLLGYENRVLAAQDFNDDKKDAGEIGAGHAVTALYELVPVGAEPAAKQPGVDSLKYQAAEPVGSALRGVPRPATELTEAAGSGELLTLKLRYKQPEGTESKLLEVPLKNRGGQFQAASKDLQFAAAVASFGMILRGSEHRGSGNLAATLEIAGASLGEDAGGYRAEFIDLVRKAQSLGAK